uniref:FAD:protein FMN transferase n=1 Tax=candidate division WOR-3 bacterium TaxID=2052148 RepID=A0A7C3YZ37_UNCW3
MRFFRNTLIFFVLFFLLIYFSFFRNKIYYKEFFLFDTIVEIKFFSRNPFIAKKTFNEIEKEYNYIDSLCSPLIEKCIENKLISEIVRISKEISEETSGAFDVSIGVIMKLWNRFKEPILPDTEEIIKNLKFVDYSKIVIKNDSVIPSKNQIIDIGGIAKGYAIKKGIEIMKKNGIKSGMINAGGDIGILGDKNGKFWKIGIRDPFDKNSLIDTLYLKNTSCATSGDYERYFEINNKIYHHILDPKTGYPANTFRSVTVIYDDPVYADAYATAIFVLGKNGIEFAKRKGLKVIIVEKNKEIIRINI